MEVGFVGLGKMGYPMVERLLRDGHQIVVSDIDKKAIKEAEIKGAIPADSLLDLVNRLNMPRAVWLMLPSGKATEETITKAQKDAKKILQLAENQAETIIEAAEARADTLVKGRKKSKKVA